MARPEWHVLYNVLQNDQGTNGAECHANVLVGYVKFKEHVLVEFFNQIYNAIDENFTLRTVMRS